MAQSQFRDLVNNLVMHEAKVISMEGVLKLDADPKLLKKIRVSET